MRNPPVRDPVIQRLRDDEVIAQWMREGWGAPNWKEFLSKKKGEKRIFSGKRQLNEFLKRNADVIQRKEFSHKDVQYALSKSLEEVSYYHANVMRIVDLLAKRVDHVLDSKNESQRRLRIQSLLVDLGLNLMMNVEFYCNSVTDRGTEIATLFLAEYIKEMGLLLGRIKREHKISVEAAFDSYKKMFQE